MLSSIKDYAIGFCAIALLTLLTIIKYLFTRNKELEKTNNIHNKIEDIRKEQEINKHKILEKEKELINDKVNDIKKSKKSLVDKLNSL